MAVSVATVVSRDNLIVFDITATADADTTTGAFAHGLPEAPTMFWITGLQIAARISLWVVTTVDATNFALAKATTAGSGAAGAQARLVVIRNPALVAGRTAQGGVPNFTLTP